MINKLIISGYKNFYYEETLDLTNESSISGIFGSNGVGKTNLLDAIQFIKELITNERIRLNNKDYRSLYLEQEDVLTELTIDFNNNNIRYVWTIHLSDRIEYEQLYIYLTNQPSKIYEYTSPEKTEHINLSRGALTWGGMYSTLKQSVSAKGFGKASILSQLIAYNDYYSDLERYTQSSNLKETTYGAKLHLLLNNMLDVSSLKLEELLNDSIGELLNSTTKEMSKSEQASLYMLNVSNFFNKKLIVQTHRIANESHQFLKHLTIDNGTLLEDARYNDILFWLKRSDFTIESLELKLTHIENTDIEKLPFYILYSELDDQYYEVYVKHNNRRIKLRHESLGTIKYLELLVTAIVSMERDSVFVVDELDSSLFGSLVSLLLDEYRESEKSQLLFTSHNLELLDHDLLKDEIFFIERDEDNIPAVVPLNTIKGIRARDNFKSDFKNGRYVHVPFV